MSSKRTRGTSPQEPNEQDRIEVTSDDYGCHRARADRDTEVWSALDVDEACDGKTKMHITGYWHEEEPPRVEILVDQESASMAVSLHPDDGLELAADLEAVASRAKQGAADEGGA